MNRAGRVARYVPHFTLHCAALYHIVHCISNCALYSAVQCALYQADSVSNENNCGPLIECAHVGSKERVVSELHFAKIYFVVLYSAVM